MIENLTEIVAQSYNELIDAINEARQYRRTASHNMNNRSSRSHAIYKLVIESSQAQQVRGPVVPYSVSLEQLGLF